MSAGPAGPKVEARRSRMISAAKVILPLAALALLSTLFLVSDRVSPEDAIPYADLDVADRLREPRLTGARYAGMTEDGAALQFQAEAALPMTDATEESGASSGLARELRGQVDTPDGVTAILQAGEARLDPKGTTLILSGGIRFDLSSGYHIGFGSAEMKLDRTGLVAREEIVAEGPMGRLTAGTLEIRPAAEIGPERYVMVFKGGVRLVYRP